MNEKRQQRFWACIQIGHPDACWEWQAGKFNQGYGCFWTGEKVVTSHRLAYTLTYGPIPVGRFVCHKCDNRACCNPSHLYVGTHEDNTRDAIERGRWNPRKGKTHPWHTNPEKTPRGERHSQAKLADEEVMEIRRRWAEKGETQSALAVEFGITHSAVNHIVHGKAWPHLPIIKRRSITRGQYRAVLNDDIIQRIRMYLLLGDSRAEIARRYKLENSTVCGIANRLYTQEGLQIPKASWRGERHSRTSLTDAKVAEIKRVLDQEVSLTVLGKLYGVSIHVISKIKSGKNWSWVEPAE